jgi:hypothetical protein
MSETISSPGNYTITADQTQNISFENVSGSTSQITFTALQSTPPPPSNDYQLFVQPYLVQRERIRQIAMKPYTGQHGTYGYDARTGLFGGGNIEASPAIGVPAGNNDCDVLYDNNMEGGYFLDRLNLKAGVVTHIYSTAWNLVSTKTWYGVGGCSKPFKSYTYPHSFPLLDRRDPTLGSASPVYTSLINPATKIGGTGSNCGTGGQTWFLFKDAGVTPMTAPLIVTEFPSSNPVGINSDLEELSFLIDLLDLQKNASEWQTGVQNAMAQYPFKAPRQALHFYKCMRDTAAWSRLPTLTHAGLTIQQMMLNAINTVFTPSGSTGPMGVKGAMGSDGGIYQQWGGGGSSDTPESNFQTIAGLDDSLPSLFGH